MADSRSPQKYRLRISYEGTEYEGWQRLSDGKPTVQGTLEGCLSKLFGEPIKVQGSGRTDSGVHAVGQEVHFLAFNTPRTNDIIYSLNCLLPRSVVVRRGWIAPLEFHAQRSAVDKTYKYRIFNDSRPTALNRQLSWWVREKLDLENLNAIAETLLGFQDFKSFQTSGSDVKTTERHISKAVWQRRGQILEFEIVGSGFLKQMVRTIVGTSVQLTKSKKGPESMRAILEAKDRRAAGLSAPAHGLFLFRVRYPRSLDNKCRKL